MGLASSEQYQHLVIPSRRALVSIRDAVVLGTIKETDSLRSAVQDIGKSMHSSDLQGRFSEVVKHMQVHVSRLFALVQ